MYTLTLKQNAKKELAKLEDSLQIRIGYVFEELKRDPFQGKILHGNLRNLRSIRVWPYRIIYEIRKHELIILVVDIVHRKDAYR